MCACVSHLRLCVNKWNSKRNNLARAEESRRTRHNARGRKANTNTTLPSIMSLRRNNNAKRSTPKRASSISNQKAYNPSNNRTAAQSDQHILSNKKVPRTLVWRIIYFLCIPFLKWFHAFSTEGSEHLQALIKEDNHNPPITTNAQGEKKQTKWGKGILFITRHTTHNFDIALGLLTAPEYDGNLPLVIQ